MSPMNARMPSPEGVIRNDASTALILASLAAALCLTLLPWQGTALLICPDFILIVLIYWCMEEPRRVGATSAFFVGLLADIAENTFTGQNALVYSLAAYLALNFRLRILSFNWGLQALHIFLILFLGQAIFTLEQVILGATFPPSIFFLRSVLGMMFWPIISWMIELRRRHPSKDDIA